MAKSENVEGYATLKGDNYGQRSCEASEVSSSARPFRNPRKAQQCMKKLSYDDEIDLDLGLRDFTTEPSPIGDNIPIIVATDFGTTFSAVAFARREEHARVHIVVNYPHDPMDLCGRPTREVPSQIWYPNSLEKLKHKRNFPQEGADAMGFDDIFAAFDDKEKSSWLQGSEIDGTGEAETSKNVQPKFFWGYGVQNLVAPDMDRNQFSPLSRFKLLLDESENTQQIRDELRPILDELKSRGIIERDEDVIADYLTQLFLHTKDQLKIHHGVTDATLIEHVLCVPVIWRSQALRKMQYAMEKAVRQSGFGTTEALFLVSEPEAAATYTVDRGLKVNVRTSRERLLELRLKFQAGEAFLILDAGGGTVDATTYMTDQTHPLRLSKELVEPQGQSMPHGLYFDLTNSS